MPDLAIPLATDALESNGFLVLPRVLGPETIEFCLDEIRDMPADSDATRVRRGVPFARRNLLEQPWLRELLTMRDVEAITTTFAPSLIPVRAILFDKTGLANWNVAWHQDRSIAVQEKIEAPGYGPWSKKAGVVHVQPPMDVLRRMVTLRLHLDPCGPENGPLRVIPGTHDQIRRPKEIEARLNNSMECTTPAGGAVVMRPLLLHASSRASAGAHRRILHVEFGPPSLDGGLRWAFTG